MKHSIKYCLCFLIALGFYYNGNAFGNIVAAPTCSQSDVQAAINSAVDFDTVSVPAGSCTWTTPVNLMHKALTLKGAGISSTIITDATPTTGYDQSALYVLGDEGKLNRITGFTFTGVGDSAGVVQIRGSSKIVRIDHCKFTNTDGYSIVTYGETYGVIDHNEFTSSSSSAFITVGGNNLSSWNLPLSLGTDKAFYIEDNTFNNSYQHSAHFMWLHGGGRYVVRHNTIGNQNIDVHGYCGDASGVSYEIYDNHWATSADQGEWMVIRGGTGVIFNNTITVQPGVGLPWSFKFFEYRVDYTTDALCHNYPSTINSGCCCNYPCEQQVGRTGSNGLTLEPVRLWNNVISGSTATYQTADLPDYCSTVCGHSQVMSDFIKPNRDFYFLSNTPQVNGSGLYSQIPGTCSINDSYWATDQRTLYKCTSTGWTLFYKPFRYPHPLANDTVPKFFSQ